jgi:hypothetical protein
LRVWRIAGSRSCFSFLFDEGTWIIVASTMVPVAILMPLGRQMFVYLVQHRPAQFVLFQQMAEPADGRLVRRGRAAQVHAHEPAQHGRLVQRLLHARIGEIESLLQK